MLLSFAEGAFDAQLRAVKAALHPGDRICVNDESHDVTFVRADVEGLVVRDVGDRNGHLGDEQVVDWVYIEEVHVY
jgi:Cys-tRNA synthase (O-phospho-L-seryl-tRNA:Cys-tRNA synthase)